MLHTTFKLCWSLEGRAREKSMTNLEIEGKVGVVEHLGQGKVPFWGDDRQMPAKTDAGAI